MLNSFVTFWPTGLIWIILPGASKFVLVLTSKFGYYYKNSVVYFASAFYIYLTLFL